MTAVIIAAPAGFPLAPEVLARVQAAAAKAKMTPEAWLDKHLRSYFGIR